MVDGVIVYNIKVMMLVFLILQEIMLYGIMVGGFTIDSVMEYGFIVDEEGIMVD